MPSNKSVRVYLPQKTPFVELPPGQAGTLERIIAAGLEGINSLELVAEGDISVRNNISALRTKGALIRTERRSAVDWRGENRSAVAHYFYEGWA